MDNNYEYTFEIDTTPEAVETLAELAVGIKNFDQAMNEVLQQVQYLSNEGFAITRVTGAQLTVAFSCDRIKDDVAQDYIFDNMLELGDSRETNFKITDPNGDVIEGECTFCNIKPPSGDSAALPECSFEIHFNGKPTFTPAV